MKVKEILEILQVPEEELLTKLSNVGIEANLETDIAPDIIKKLSKVYKVEIKASKTKKTTPKKAKVEEAETEKKPEPKAATKEKETKPEPKEKPKQAETKAKKQAETKEKKQTKPAKTEKKAAAKPKAEIKAKEKTKPQEEEVEIELRHVYDDKYNEYEKEVKVYTRLKNVKKKQNVKGGRQSNYGRSDKANERILTYIPGMTVAEVADGMNAPIGEVIRKLIMLGYMANATQILDRDVIEVIAEEFKYQVKDKITEDITKFEEIVIEDDEKNLVTRPPIVTIMGHVDHGKTTLLDTIRHSRVVASEAGGITQHIGAYQVKKDDKLITFIDTPGHAAFTEMRARGANITDIVVLVVAADDGVMPQTREAIDHAKAAKVPIIVAINKMDKPEANPDKIKQELSALDLIPEEWGGKTIYVPISALKGEGVDEILEMVLLTAEMENFRANPNRLGVGTVLEAKLDKGRGPVATLLIKNGTIKVGDPLVVGNTCGKIRAMTDETRAQLKSAGPSKAVEVTGLENVPFAGDSFMVFEDEKTARLVAEERAQRAFDKEMGVGKPISLANLFEQLSGNNKELNLIIKGDVHGSIEAIIGSLEKLSVEGVKINVVRSGVGTVTETDVNLAVASNSIIIAFNVRPMGVVLDYAKEKNIEIRLYNIIYKVLEDIEAAMKGMLDPVYEEKVLGQAEVRQIFKASKIGTIAGCYVTTGTINRNAEVRLIRDAIVVYEGKLSSLKRFKDDVREVKTGFECGITIENYNDIKEGDVIEAFVMEKVK
ncbi:MAG TPA: translation initiation factor IF-2 [Acholeplasmataceae bacterium]|jgi:translation initiation factor IF-2|nr:translation initiation factor IF-2 [Acholeplasmataceae bacterium]